jgi:hypothetical protein
MHIGSWCPDTANFPPVQAVELFDVIHHVFNEQKGRVILRRALAGIFDKSLD